MDTLVKKKVLVTLDGGGYENEARMLLRQLGPEFCYVYVTSRDAVTRAPNLPFCGPLYVLPTLTRKLERSSRIRATGRFVLAVIKALRTVYGERPDAIVGMASPICLPLFLWGKLFGVRCIFVESITRTSKLSLTGRLASALFLVDRLYVQWPELSSRYPKVIYAGTVI